jgi:hypothetical protein
MEKSGDAGQGKRPSYNGSSQPRGSWARNQLKPQHGMVAELDVFTYDADKPAISRFHAAKKKLSTYLGSRFGN